MKPMLVNLQKADGKMVAVLEVFPTDIENAEIIVFKNRAFKYVSSPVIKREPIFKEVESYTPNDMEVISDFT